MADEKIVKIFSKILCIAFATWATIYIWNSKTVSNEMLYGRANYQDGTYGEIFKIILMLIAAIWIFAFICLTPNKKISFITKLGENTFPVFLCHGFVVRYLTEYSIFCYGTKLNLLISASIAALLVVALGNVFVGNIFNYIFMGKWMDAVRFQH